MENNPQIDLDRHILDFVMENPGKSKEDVVRAMEKFSSRITVLKHIQHLVDNKSIILRREKRNSQIYKIFINIEDIQAALHIELSKFESSYSILLDASLLRFEEIESRFKGLDEDAQWPWIQKCLKLEEELLAPLIQIYILIHNIFTVVKAFEWQNELPDKNASSDLYSTAQRFLREIQQKLFDTIKQIHVFRNYNEKIMSFDLLNYSIKPSIDSFSQMLQIFQGWELVREFSPIMDTLWKMTFNSISFDGSHFLKVKKKERSNWKIVLSQHPRFPVDQTLL